MGWETLYNTGQSQQNVVSNHHGDPVNQMGIENPIDHLGLDWILACPWRGASRRNRGGCRWPARSASCSGRRPPRRRAKASWLLYVLHFTLSTGSLTPVLISSYQQGSTKSFKFDDLLVVVQLICRPTTTKISCKTTRKSPNLRIWPMLVISSRSHIR